MHGIKLGHRLGNLEIHGIKSGNEHVDRRIDVISQSRAVKISPPVVLFGWVIIYTNRTHEATIAALGDAREAAFQTSQPHPCTWPK